MIDVMPTLVVLGGVVSLATATAVVQEMVRRRIEVKLERAENRAKALEQALAAAPDGWFAWLPGSGDNQRQALSSDLAADAAANQALSGGLCSRRLAVLLDLYTGQQAGFNDILAGFSRTDAVILARSTLSLRRDGEPFERILSHYAGHFPGGVPDADLPISGDEPRRLRVTGRRAVADDGTPVADILWIRDISGEHETTVSLAAEVTRLRGDHSHLQAALDAVPLPVWLRDADLRVTFANRTFRQAVAGDTPPDSGQELAAGPTALEMRALASAARAAGERRSASFHLVLDGIRKLVSVTEVPVLPPGGDPAVDLFTLGVAEDQTPLATLQATIEHESASHADVLERLGTAIAIFGADTRLHFRNAAFARMWRLDDEWLDDQPSYSEFLEILRTRRLMPEVADWPAFREVELARFKSLVGPQEDLLHLPDDQTLRRVLAPHPLGGLLATYENVTDRLALEASLNTLVAVQKETLDHLSEAVAVFSADGRLTQCNPAFCTLWDVAAEGLAHLPTLSELINRLPSGPGTEGTLDVWDEVRRLLVAPPQDRAVRRRWVSRPDRPPMAVTGVPLPDGGVMFTFLDVGERRVTAGA